MASAATASAPAIVAKGASKLFLDGAVVAFHQLSLEVRRNEILCVVGPSGCGKTTLLRCIAGLTDLSDGEILVQGKPVGPARPTASPWCSSISACCRGRRCTRTPPSGCRWRACRAPHIKERGRALSGAGRPHRLRAPLSLSALGRHAAAGRAGAGAGDQSRDPADGRAVRRARRADPRGPAGGAAGS